MIQDAERISLKVWFESIISPCQREKEICRDLMSPPPHTAKDYSMGAVSSDKIQQYHALIENRGYKVSSVEKKDSTETPEIYSKHLDRFIELIQNETESFFQLQAIGEKR
jgi:hypothetical protein